MAKVNAQFNFFVVFQKDWIVGDLRRGNEPRCFVSLGIKYALNKLSRLLSCKLLYVLMLHSEVIVPLIFSLEKNPTDTDMKIFQTMFL